ncbi:lytic polysaccharide monooxygenase [Streptomyces sp. JJ66]|uniref:lytic polysaccharide monooxygenase auxiliary activity family 9 protein n=1 Tax=Streptomyces sp. JJ66 TaxID=2803843 RepID=UPI001C588D99|nr:lytic polysaccharide monooxygenase auxiliary activity family 9 protein [Streptomyces sp. JJ66]MBW1600631.1 lytic polysaccharide monooxygenase [Streptomyces sp. JJ66]
MRKLTSVAAALGIAAATVLATAGHASAHGYSTSPVSRQLHCAQGTVTGCGQIRWEPQSVEGPGGFPARGPSDGTLCSGGNARFAELDDPRGGNWPTTQLNSGQQYTFTWRNTAPHSTSTYQYYITRDDWRPGLRLTRADLERTPFLTVDLGGRRPGATESHTGRLPSGKSGHHLILAVWNIADTNNAFYACSDVRF